MYVLMYVFQDFINLRNVDVDVDRWSRLQYVWSSNKKLTWKGKNTIWPPSNTSRNSTNILHDVSYFQLSASPCLEMW